MYMSCIVEMAPHQKRFLNLKDNALQDSLVADICGLVQVKVEQCYCCSVWVAAEIFRFLFDNFADLGQIHLVWVRILSSGKFSLKCVLFIVSHNWPI